MLLREAQEEARIVYTARRDSATEERDALLSHICELTTVLKKLQITGPSGLVMDSRHQVRLVGLMLLAGLGLANEMNVDSLKAFKSLLLEESP